MNESKSLSRQRKERMTRARVLIEQYLVERVFDEGPLHWAALVGDDGVDEPDITLRDCVTRLTI
jgi:hypothetical protein